MGTNYYLQSGECCKTCGHETFPQKHIGKSSGGWCFALHVYPDEGIKTLEDYIQLFDKYEIKDEYNRIIPKDEMLSIITYREDRLLRHVIDGDFCIGWGEGSYDYIIRDFC